MSSRVETILPSEAAGGPLLDDNNDDSFVHPALSISETITAAAAAADEAHDASNKFRYVALDLDRTLLNSQHQVSEKTIEYIRKLDANGFGIMVATGRSLSTVYETILALNLPHALPVICSNGALGVLCQPDESKPNKVAVTPLFDVPVPEPVARRTITLAKEIGFMSQYYVGDDIYADPTTEKDHLHVQKYKDLTGANTICVENLLNVLESNKLPTKQLVLFPKEDQDEVMVKFEDAFCDPQLLIDNAKATLVRGSLGWFIEVLHPQVCKGNGLKRMCENHLSIDIESVVAFGDGDNDIEFLQMAGLGIAMGNSRAVVKEIADQVLDLTNDDDGVMQTLESMEHSGQLLLASS